MDVDGHGWMTCWDKEVAQKVNVGQLFNISFEEKGGYKHITAVGPAEETIGQTPKPNNQGQSVIESKNPSARAINAMTPMYVSYAKDILVSLLVGREEPAQDVTAYTHIAISCIKTMHQEFENGGKV